MDLNDVSALGLVDNTNPTEPEQAQVLKTTQPLVKQAENSNRSESGMGLVVEDDINLRELELRNDVEVTNINPSEQP